MGNLVLNRKEENLRKERQLMPAFRNTMFCYKQCLALIYLSNRGKEIGILMVTGMSLLFTSWNQAESIAGDSTNSSKNLRKV
uniref:Uncharacterized protein n=1 Tax=Glossina morsitans morsitans TaxID=37546 RepID=A0A1B0FR93_GLOMM